MDEDFRRLKRAVYGVVTYKPRQHDELIAEKLLGVWLELRQHGVQAFDFAHGALLMAETVMSHYDTAGENVIFGEYLQKAGARKIKYFGELPPDASLDA